MSIQVGKPTLQVGRPVPDAKVDAYVRGERAAKRLSLSDFHNRWLVLFFYPRDFTFVCPTEIAAFARLHPQFERERAVIIGASTDSFYSHKAWYESDPRLQDVTYPVVADTSQELARAFDVLLEDGAALRGTFIIDPEGILRHMSVTELSVGRNVDETLRTLQALRTGELCPAGWKPGQATLTSTDDWLAKAFPRLPERVLAETAKRSQTVEFSEGQMVFRQGDAPDRLYVIVRGDAEVVRNDPDARETLLTTLGPGEYFGEIGLLTEHRRTASVRAKTDLELLALDWDAFRQMIEASEPTAKDFAEIVRARLARG